MKTTLDTIIAEKKKLLKIEYFYTFLLFVIYIIDVSTGKNTTSQILSSTLHLDDWTKYFRYRDTIKLYKNKMDSKVIKSHLTNALWKNLMLY